MKLNPLAVVFWLALGLGGYLLSGGNPMVAGWCVFGGLCLSLTISFLTR